MVIWDRCRNRDFGSIYLDQAQNTEHFEIPIGTLIKKRFFRSEIKVRLWIGYPIGCSFPIIFPIDCCDWWNFRSAYDQLEGAQFRLCSNRNRETKILHQDVTYTSLERPTKVCLGQTFTRLPGGLPIQRTKGIRVGNLPCSHRVENLPRRISSNSL